MRKWLSCWHLLLSLHWRESRLIQQHHQQLHNNNNISISTSNSRLVQVSWKSFHFQICSPPIQRSHRILLSLFSKSNVENLKPKKKTVMAIMQFQSNRKCIFHFSCCDISGWAFISHCLDDKNSLKTAWKVDCLCWCCLIRICEIILNCFAGINNKSNIRKWNRMSDWKATRQFLSNSFLSIFISENPFI